MDKRHRIAVVDDEYIPKPYDSSILPRQINNIPDRKKQPPG